MRRSLLVFTSVRDRCPPDRAASEGASSRGHALVRSFSCPAHDDLRFAPSVDALNLRQKSSIEQSRRRTLSKTGLIEGTFVVA